MLASSQPKFPGTVAFPVIRCSPAPRTGVNGSFSFVLPAGSFGLQIITGGTLQIAEPSPATAIACIWPEFMAPTIGVSAKRAVLPAVRTQTNFAVASAVTALVVGQSDGVVAFTASA